MLTQNGQDTDTTKSLRIFFCNAFYSEEGITTNFIFSTILVTVILAIDLFVMCRLYSRRRKFIIRQRAPLLAVLHIALILVSIVTCLVIEILIEYSIIDWDLDSRGTAEQIPMLRRILKFVLLYCRYSMSFLVFYR